MGRRLIVFSDLDGTLLEAETYSFEPAAEALALMEARGVPLLLCTSKTRAEVEPLRARLKNTHPFISENGGGLFIPRGYFPFQYGHASEQEGPYDVLRLGTPYAELRELLLALRAKGFALRGFGDMNAEEVASLTRLPLEEARRAREREFDELFVLLEGAPSMESIRAEVEARGYNLTRGAFPHLLGKSDKGSAVARLEGLMKRLLPGALSVAFGDSPNDIPMLLKVDRPFAVGKPDGSYDSEITARVPGLVLAEGAGPVGWNRTMLALLAEP